MLGQSSPQTFSSVRFYIMRHGMAEHHAPRDELRELVEFGEQQVKESAQWLNRHYPNQKIDLAIVSPYVRTKQTYSIAKRYLSVTKMVETAMVTPDADVDHARDFLSVLSEDTPTLNSVLIVSHMPMVSMLLAELSYECQAPLFNTGSIAIVECQRAALKGHVIEHFQGVE